MIQAEKIRQQVPNKPYKDIKCGTYSGYQRHYRLKESACDACKNGASEYVKIFYHKNKEKIRELRKKNPSFKAKKKRRSMRRKVRLKGNKTEVYTVEQVLDLYGTICYLCNEEIDLTAPRNCTGHNWQYGLHIDHVIDVQYNGSDTLDNVKPTHAICNINKRRRPPRLKGGPV